jgi:hypothetical protein
MANYCRAGIKSLRGTGSLIKKLRSKSFEIAASECTVECFRLRF